MSRIGGPDPAFVRARRTLLDALDALGPHRSAVILVGAQAVYLNVGEAREALSSFTIDADLALNPAQLPDEPVLQEALARAGFELRDQPGLWFGHDGTEVDLLVPASIAGTGRRGADLGGRHDRRAAMRAAGLEAALFDNSPHEIAALDPKDPRTFTIAIAGPAALLVAKLHKLGQRNERSPDRLKNKDASDLFLLLRGFGTQELAGTLQRLRSMPLTANATRIAMDYLRDMFTADSQDGIRLLRAAVAGIEDEETVALSCIVLAQDLLDAFS